jgi:S-DNA-T family DNA segregation ATPase FtsK/SpoIIIE
VATAAAGRDPGARRVAGPRPGVPPSADTHHRGDTRQPGRAGQGDGGQPGAGRDPVRRRAAVCRNHRGQQTRVKVSKIVGLADDLALALAAKTIRIQAPIPKKGLVGIEVPNQQIALVALRDIIESEAWEACESPLRLGLGQDVSGSRFAADLTAMPHLLIAGTTGSGKSVCINAILAALAAAATAGRAEDAHGRSQAGRTDALQRPPASAGQPVVVDMERVVGALQWVLREMDGRYRRLPGRRP